MTPTLFVVGVLSIVSIIAIAYQIATPPEVRVIVGVIFVLGAFYFREIDPLRHRRPVWTVPMFLIIGVVFVLSGLHLFVPPTIQPVFEVLAAIGFIALGLLSWFVAGICCLREIPNTIEPLAEPVDESPSEANRTGDDSERL